MRLLLVSLISFFLVYSGWSTEVKAEPTKKLDADTNECLYSVENTQSNHLSTNGKYEQHSMRKYKDVICKVDVYDGPSGIGYIATGIVVIGNQSWIKQKHVGPETDREIVTEWTKRRAF